MDVNDLKLIEGCKAEDRQAQKALYFKYRNMLLGLCRRYAKDNQEAEDLLQEGFIKIYTDLYQYKPIGSFPAWLRKVMINTALKHIRSKKIEFEELTESIFYDLESLDTADSQLPNKEVLVNIIQQLPSGYRSVFNLYAIEGYSHEEVGEILQISVNTSRSQYFKARKLIRQLFEAKAIEK